ncbi:hypothetical protein RZS08_39550, partial [Arthrospira platensis SPKY1]|nr:hypothetical protein [Arthrospira platensis SPKY1]
VNSQTLFVVVSSVDTNCGSTIGSFTVVVQEGGVANAVAPIVFCDTDGVNDGETTVDITSITPLILGAQDPTVFTVDYYLSEQEAIAQQNALTAAQAANFVTGSTTLWAQVSNNV